MHCISGLSTAYIYSALVLICVRFYRASSHTIIFAVITRWLWPSSGASGLSVQIPLLLKIVTGTSSSNVGSSYHSDLPLLMSEIWYITIEILCANSCFCIRQSVRTVLYTLADQRFKTRTQVVRVPHRCKEIWDMRGTCGYIFPLLPYIDIYLGLYIYTPFNSLISWTVPHMPPYHALLHFILVLARDYLYS